MAGIHAKVAVVGAMMKASESAGLPVAMITIRHVVVKTEADEVGGRCSNDDNSESDDRDEPPPGAHHTDASTAPSEDTGVWDGSTGDVAVLVQHALSDAALLLDRR